MSLLKIGGYVCILAGMGLVVLSFLIPQSQFWLVIGGFATIGAGVMDLLAYRYLSPIMESLPKPEGVEEISSIRGTLQMSRELSRQGARKMESATATLREMNRSNHLRQHGHKAKVEVQAMRDTNQLINFDPIIEFTLNVQPDDGEPYSVEGYRQVVSKIVLPRIRVGGEYNAFIDPEERTSLYVNWQQLNSTGNKGIAEGEPTDPELTC